MIPGQQRSDVPYVWPSTVWVAEQRPTLVYLDLNHWIGLAQAKTGHSKGASYIPALEAARREIDLGRVMFPLAAGLYQEMGAIKDPRQRSDIASVMEELSHFQTLTSHTTVLERELEAALDTFMPPRTVPIDTVLLLDRGFGHAFGRSVRLVIESKDGSKSMEELRESWKEGPEAFDKMVSEADQMSERRMLAGPRDEDLPRLVQLGYNPQAAAGVVERRADQERRLKVLLAEDPQWRRGRLRDVVAARYLVNELGGMIARSLQARGLGAAALQQTREAQRQMVDGMPSGDVYVTLTTASHRNPQLPTWSTNDVFDIDAMSLAVAYCDVVVTEKHRQHQITSTGLDGRLDTKVLSTPAELVDALANAT